jgi:O-antigen ligase
VFPAYAPASIKHIYDHAHNDYLEFLLETGVPGLVLLLVFLALLARAAAAELSGRAKILRIGAIASAATMAVHSFFDFNLHILSNLLLFGAVLGMIVALSTGNDHETRESGRRKPKEAAPLAAEDDGAEVKTTEDWESEV